jgi:o-succinylbenzoate synthase
LKATYHKYILQFKNPSGTSRGILTQKETWFMVLENANKKGIGECGILRGLSFDDVPNYEEKLQWVCQNIHLGLQELLIQLQEFPSIQFGLETAFLSLHAADKMVLFPSNFTNGKAAININGLVWMGKYDFMKTQINQKLKDGFTCIKLKIGALDFDKELELLHYIRKDFDKKTIEIRVDANGAFAKNEALDKLKTLSKYDLHSIEQPIMAGNIDAMANLCSVTPLPIALDEELIGVYAMDVKETLLQLIKPQYIILKPSLVGGMQGTTDWIQLAESKNIGWWITSALESNIGLNAIAQYAYTLQNKMPQGLGTGGLYTNNFDCPLEIKNGQLRYNTSHLWNVYNLFGKL